MEKRARWVLVTTAVLLGSMLWWHSSRQAPAPVQVHTAAVSVRDIYNCVTVSGRIEASESTALCPAANAAVEAVYVSVGDTVAPGDVLCTLRPDAVETPALSDGVQAAWEALSDGLAAQTVKTEETRVLRAPVAGTVLSLPAAGETVYAGVPCAQIADLDSLQVRASCPELYAGQIAAGQSANVTVAALSDQTFGASVQSLAPVAVRAVSLTGSSGEATVDAVLTLLGDTQGLRPGYSATVKIFTERHTDTTVVPMEAICQRGEQEYVFCVEGGRAVSYPVETGLLLETTVEVSKGVPADAVVILSPPDTLEDGMAVEVAA